MDNLGWVIMWAFELELGASSGMSTARSLSDFIDVMSIGHNTIVVALHLCKKVVKIDMPRQAHRVGAVPFPVVRPAETRVQILNHTKSPWSASIPFLPIFTPFAANLPDCSKTPSFEP